ncbi:16S rRNA (guanine(527)-N(7))-methyltransferase RsmG [Labrys wisconsinensis]|uniref:Ribosomal RNA small subunit methyltransferase G n=1 Tax=Labrys wisconsinensis TaxID=425677 RepID=A0ABU0J1C7_9HYPH|nr:16S rRNA (guanine(527)-N(7))-methyltransferase RsmG [Labrys wisconsinensis]MDQ0468056.1 16S rRNA (guanine527-N7)-methyltransferase [Labrys wisconsinensis]
MAAAGHRVVAGEREGVLRELGVSRETAAALDAYAELLTRWQAVKNLVAPSTLAALWRRHILDSGQLLPHVGPARALADFGSGAGFPGLVLAVLMAGRPGVQVHLVESNNRKAAFLREAIRVTGAPAEVHAVRIEDFVARPPATMDLVTARALAPLSDLLGLSEGLLKTGARALFLKGQDVEQELTEAAKSWRIQATLIPSITDPAGRIVHVAAAERHSAPDR